MSKDFSPSEVGDAIKSLVEAGVSADEIVNGALINSLALASAGSDEPTKTTTVKVTIDPDAMRKMFDAYVANLRKAEGEGRA